LKPAPQRAKGCLKPQGGCQADPDGFEEGKVGVFVSRTVWNKLSPSVQSGGLFCFVDNTIPVSEI
jgi:hypothetical protein